MELEFPTPRKSRFNTAIPEPSIDYNMVAPLAADGSQLYCKRYAAGNVVATFTAGQSITAVLSGSVFHSGGHCQFSISYDDNTFVVLRTDIHDCFVGTGLRFAMTIPSATPACDRCTFAWTWVNAVGNREFYMNCADIRIVNDATPASDQVLSGKKLTVANMPGYPTIPEFPPADDDMSDLYDAAPVISVTGSGEGSEEPPASSSAPPTATATATSTSTSTSTRITATTTATTPSPSQTGTPATGRCRIVNEKHCTGSRTFVSCSAAKRYITRTCPANTTCRNKSSSVECVRNAVSSPATTCVTNQSKCISASAWALCSNGAYTNQRCPKGTSCTDILGKARCS